MLKNAFYLFGAVLLLNSCEPKLPQDVQTVLQDLPAELDYNLHIKPILSDKCFACHGPDSKKQKAGLRLDLAENAFAQLPESPEKVAISPGSLKNSEVFRRIISEDSKIIMPTPESHLSLTTYEKAVLIKWIQDGAEYRPHWAFVAPKKEELPRIKNEVWTKNEVDYFIAAKLEEKGLTTSPMAEKSVLLRRLFLDLTGLPPTITDIDKFLNDKSPIAYHKIVDSLLNSQQFGEHLAISWLDLARFADTHGYTVDRYRDMSPYRDWVIDAFNSNIPFNTFIQWQLAGDLFPEASREMRIATAFNRNHPQNMEGGIIDEEFRNEYVVDRTNTLGDAFLGISLGCARCHDHRYDPISTKEYYQLYSFFNNQKEAGQISWDNSTPSPSILLTNKEQEETIAFIKNDLASLESKEKDLLKSGESAFIEFLKTEKYKELLHWELPKVQLQAFYNFDKNLLNQVSPTDKAYVTLNYGAKEVVDLRNGKKGKGVFLNGDAWLEFGDLGVFSKSQDFSIGLNIQIPEDFKEGVILHKTSSERLFNYKGYHLYIRADGKLEAMMAHSAPANAITKVSKTPLPKGKWIHLTLNYDGSGKASGLNIYLDGRKMSMLTEMDALEKDILFKKEIFQVQPPLQIGGWDRGFGLKNGLVDNITVYNRKLSVMEIATLSERFDWKNVLKKSFKNLTRGDKILLREYFYLAFYQPYQTYLQEIESRRIKLAEYIEPIDELMVMKDFPGARKTFVLERGGYENHGEEVFPDTPNALFPFPKDLPRNRYGLALWLTDEKHPLTARVAVNRFWQNIFGTGLVKTAEDFGNQGELPSHKELLDYLAVDFIETGWNVKALIKKMVTSATYMQDSKRNSKSLQIDAENRLLSSGPSGRLSAEMIRDNALRASGLLKLEIGGKSIKPYQPKGLWEINNTHYVPDSTDIIYKRSLYIFAKRSVPNPTLGTFDAPDRSICLNRRQKTNTPLQALVTLNDPTYIEVSKVLGESMIKETSTPYAIIQTYRKLTAKYPNKDQINLLVKLYENELQKFNSNPKRKEGWLNIGLYKIDKNLDLNKVAAYSVVANTILNSDACLTKR